MPPQLSPNVKEKTADAWHSALSPYLHPGEVVWAFAKTNSLRPMINGIAVTNARVLAFHNSDVAIKGPKVAIDADKISSFNFVKWGAAKVLVVATHDRGEVKIGTVQEAEIDFVKFFVHELASAGYPEEIRAAVHAQSADPQEEGEDETPSSAAAPTEVAGHSHGPRPQQGRKLSDRKVERWTANWSTMLRPGEVILLLCKCMNLRPPRDALVLTNSRVMSGYTRELTGGGDPGFGLLTTELDDVTRVEIAKSSLGQCRLRISTHRDIGRDFGTVDNEDALLVATTIHGLLPHVAVIPYFSASSASSEEGPQRLPRPTPPPPPPDFVPYGSASPSATFNASQAPRPGDHVPADCVWASRRHPGPMPPSALRGNLAKRVKAMGNPAGRTMREIESALGRASARSAMGDGHVLLQWQQIWNGQISTFSSKDSHFALEFDRYGVCVGITHQWDSY